MVEDEIKASIDVREKGSSTANQFKQGANIRLRVLYVHSCSNNEINVQ